MRKLLYFFGIIVIFSEKTGFAEESKNNLLTIQSRIVAVTVYNDRALVTRQTELNLERGEYKISFDDLVPQIFDDTVKTKIEAEEVVGVKVTGIEVKRIFLEKPLNARIQELEGQIEKLRDEETDLIKRLEVLRNEGKFLESIQIKTGLEIQGQISEIKTQYKIEVKDWQSILEFVSTNSQRVKKEIITVEINKRDLNRKIDAMERELRQLKAQNVSLEKKKVTVNLETPKRSKFKLLLLYILPQASWQSIYEARASKDKTEVELTYFGEVRQNTGEDWNNVLIFLSTARPSLGAQMPELNPWWLNFQPEFHEKRKRLDIQMAPPGVSKTETSEMAMMPEEKRLTEVEALETQVLFKVLKPQDIPSDGNPHKTMIAQEDFPAQFRYFTTPKLSPYAFLKAKFTNSSEYPFLAGIVNVFLGSDYVGKSSLTNIAPTQEIELSLGVDERIHVKHDLVKKEEAFTGLLNKNKYVRYLYRITLENYKSTEEEIVVWDQIPVSQHEQITVKVLKINPETTEKEEEDILKRKEQRILRWDLHLKPKEKKEIILDFAIEYPKGRFIPNLF